ncbi:MAG TPA: response regulator, partial [Pyrinomonadaceae bacterium]|nr:response regulator [Pyrinomonadaceae bacterium]
ETAKSLTQDLTLPDGFTPPASEVQFAEVSQTPETPTDPEVEEENESMQVAAEPFVEDPTEASESTSLDFESVAHAEFEPSGSEEPVAEHPAVEEVLEGEAAALAYANLQAERVARSYDTEDAGAAVTVEEPSSPSAEVIIPMPVADLPGVSIAHTGYETIVGAEPEMLEVAAESFDCVFCSQTNEPQSITCSSCQAVLTLSDLELLLANQNADKMILRQAVEEMERQRATHEFNGDEMIVLGIGHLNLRNHQLGYSCLLEASKIQPDNVVLSGQVNSLLIRLDEIRQQEEAHLKMPKGKSILVVDDSPTVRKLISGKLEKSGHSVICANDGVEAMEHLEDFVPDLILLDITMPRMDGYQVCKNIRSKGSTKDVPVVMISGKDGFFDKVRGRMAGTTGYITKPFGPETLMKAVEMYLSGEAPDLDDEV